jgi:polysaccharide biosynthesis protein PslH
MRVLYLMPYSPVPSTFGGAIRVYHMLKALTLEHHVTVVTFGSGRDRELLRSHFGSRIARIHVLPYPPINKIRRIGQLLTQSMSRSFYFLSLYSRAMQQTIDQLMQTQTFDAVHCEFPMMGTYSVPHGLLKILDAHNVEYDNFRRMEAHAPTLLRRLHYRDEYAKIKREEIAVCKDQHRIFVTSALDKTILDKDTPEVPKHVVPNGVDTTYFAPSGGPVEPHSIVFTGMMGYFPNYDGILHFIDESLPIIKQRVPDVKLYVVGKEAPASLVARQSESIVVTGFVEDVRPYIHRAGVYIVPLRMGSGTRLKVLEAMAMKKPIVSTTIGCEGIHCADRDSLLLADTAAEFAERVIEVMHDRDLSRRLTTTGYEIVHKFYDWGRIYQQVSEIYESMSTARVPEAPRRTRSYDRFSPLHPTAAQI